MKIQRAAAYTYTALSIFVIAFQIALAAGAPWGEYAMGGEFPGELPTAMRVAAVLQACFIAWLARAVWRGKSRWQIRTAVAISLLSLVMNSMTPSLKERNLWAPVALLMFLSSAIVLRKQKNT